MNLNWNDIRVYNGSQDKAFEELICQLAHKETNPLFKKFIRKGTPDAGIECYWTLSTGKEWGWQAKWFLFSLDSSQWNQITKSIKTAIEKHPNIEKYYIAIPIDPADGRIAGKKSLLDKWNEYCKNWKTLAERKSISLEIEIWWASDIIGKLQQKDNEGLTYFWFTKNEFSEEWFNAINTSAIENLGTRYTPEINFNSSDGDIFNFLLRNRTFTNIFNNHFDLLIKLANKINNFLINNTDSANILIDEIDDIYDILDTLDFQSITPIPLEKIISSINRLYNSISSKIGILSKELRTQINYYFLDFSKEKYSLLSLLQSDKFQLANKPFLLLSGEAGIGKSHLLADFIKKCENESIPCLFLLGQHFTTLESPWNQIKSRLDLVCQFQEFLGSINSFAEVKNSRFYIVIDALNEGYGKKLWINNILGFISTIKQYPRIGCVFSIRDSYIDITLPKDIFNTFIEYKVHGFWGLEYEASKFFFENYQIEFPKIPLLHPEFHNPLFLHLLCKSLKNSGYTEIPKGGDGITSILKLLITSINKKLSSPNEFNYSASYNLVQKALNIFIQNRIENNFSYILYDKAFEMVEKITSQYIQRSGLFLEALISEGLFIKSVTYQNEEIIYFSYERYEDHLIAQYLLTGIDKIEEPISLNSSLFSIFNDIDLIYRNKGVIEALSIQIPEKFNKEIFEVVPIQLFTSEIIYDSFLQSFLWRKINSFNTQKAVEYLNKILKYPDAFKQFIDNIIIIASIPDHPFNANWLYEVLFQKSLSERDFFWTIYINENYYDGSSIKRLVDWAWNEQLINYISEESRGLFAITLCWFLSSSNRLLRDCATKALISLLRDHISILINLLDKFMDVSDPYIIERLLCVIYGCVMLSNDLSNYKELCLKLYETIFNKEKIYPNILLRDYARNIIEYALSMDYKLEIDYQKIIPPYNSDFPTNLPSNEDIDKLFPFRIEKEYRREYSCIYSILSSMATEHGRTLYGDFGRYVFQSSLRQWDIDANLLSNYAIILIFNKYGYDKDLFNNFDSMVGTGRSRNDKHIERIGKKYQWIALYEILARVSDNFKKYDRWGRVEEKESSYQGTWEPYIRNIDPSCLIKNTNRRNDDIYYLWYSKPEINWLKNNDEWIFDKSDIPNVKDLISLYDENKTEWFLLEAYTSWRQPRRIGEENTIIGRKEIWYHIRTCLVQKESIEKIKEFSMEEQNDIRWMPDTCTPYEIFNKEFYWSPAYKYFEDDYYGLSNTFDIKEFSSLYKTTINYLWEEEYDYSKEDTISIIFPSKIIFEKMNLHFSKIPGIFTNDTGEVICFDPSVKENSKSSLYIRKIDFVRFLKENNLTILWTIIGEKNIPTYNFKQNHKILHIKGIGFLNEDENVTTSMRFFKEQ